MPERRSIITSPDELAHKEQRDRIVFHCLILFFRGPVHKRSAQGRYDCIVDKNINRTILFPDTGAKNADGHLVREVEFLVVNGITSSRRVHFFSYPLLFLEATITLAPASQSASLMA